MARRSSSSTIKIRGVLSSSFVVIVISSNTSHLKAVKVRAVKLIAPLSGTIDVGIAVTNLVAQYTIKHTASYTIAYSR